jgi:hypothetical protein
VAIVRNLMAESVEGARKRDVRGEP